MAPQLEIYVDGQGSSFRTAERGYLRLSISSTRTDQSQAVQEAQSAVAKLTTTVRALATKTLDGRPHPDAAVTAFTVAPLSTVSQFQRDKHYRALPEKPKEYTVRASAEVIFRNMARLAAVSDELAQMPYVSMSETEWRLTDATRAELEREARRKAIADAVQKAQDYAGVVGRRVVAVEIKDQHQASVPGLFFRQPMAQQGMMQQQQMAQVQALQQQQQQMVQQAAQGSGMSTAVSEALMLEPKTITVSALVSAKFVSADGDGNGDSMED